MKREIVILLAALCLGSCTAEGNSYFLAKGETIKFLTMSACEKEALSTYSDGSRKYSGFECRQMLLGVYQVKSKDY